MLCAIAPAVLGEHKQILHRVALTTCSSVPAGHAWIAADWMSCIILHRDFLVQENKLEACLERLHLTEPQHETLLSKAFENLEQIASFFVKQFYQSNQLRQLVFKPHQIFTDDWIYAPLIAIYTHSDSKKVKFSDPPKEMALRTLQASYIFLSTRTSWFFRIRPSAHYVRLACLFMASNDLFLDEEICSYTWPILRGISAQRLDFSQSIEGIQDLLIL